MLYTEFQKGLYHMRKAIVTATFLALIVFQPAFAQTNTVADVTKPTISGVTTGSITSASAVVSWSTSESATSYVDFGTTDVYGNTLGEGSYVTTHSVTLLGLSASTLYHFRIRSKDAAGNEAVSTDTTVTTTSAANTNVASNTNTVVVKNTNSATNANGNANANRNTNTAVNKNANKNTNTAKNTNTSKNTNGTVNANGNTNSGTSLFNQNANENINGDGNASTLENANVDTTSGTTTATTTTGDGRAGIALIALGVVLLVGIIAFAWWKARRAPGPRP
jgi:hypothetical protein